MKKLLFSLISYLTLNVSMFAQIIAPTQNSDLIHSFTGQIIEVKGYSNGIMYLYTNDANDGMSYSLDGTNFINSEVLESGSASKLSAWSGNDRAFYYGNNANDAGEIDLRISNSGVTSLLLSGGHSATNPAITNVFHADYGSGKEWFYYMVKGAWDDLKGQEMWLYESDGTDGGTFETGQEVGFGKKIRMSGINLSGVIDGTVYDDAFYFIADMEGGGSGNYSSIFKVDYNAGGGTAALVVSSGSETVSWQHLTITDNYIYALDVSVDNSTLPFYFIPKDDLTNIGMINTMHFHNEKPAQSNNRFYAVSDPWINGTKYGIKKLAIIDENNSAIALNLNAETETDEIDNLTLSGNKLFFTATPTGGTQGIYAIRTDVEEPEFVLVDDLGGKELRGMIAVPDGIAYAVWDEPITTGTPSGNVVISQGFTDADYWLHRGTEHGNYGWKKITDLVVNGNTLYVTEEAENGTDVNIWSHDLTQSEFATTSVQFTVTDSETSEVIVGAQLVIDNGLESYSLETNNSGQAVQLDIPQGWYNYELSANGYKTISDGRIWLSGTTEKVLTMEVGDVTSINNQENNQPKVYPNPTSDLINIEATSPVIAVRLYNATGAVVKTIESENIKNVNISDLPRGVYIMVTNQSNSTISTIKITKK